jgi:heptosyltransferase-2
VAQGKDILIVGPNWVGDMVMAEPLVAALKRRHPDSSIDLLAPENVLPVARRMPDLRAAIPLPFSPHRAEFRKRFALGRFLSQRYAEAYVIPNSFISALVPFFAGVRHRHGYLREARYGLINRIAVMPPGAKRRTAEAFLRLAGEPGPSRPRLSVDRPNQEAQLQRFGLHRGAFAALMPGAEGGPTKRWPPESYAALANLLLARGGSVAVFGGPNDREICATIADLAPGVVNLGGQTRLDEAIDLIAAAGFGVANDTGLMHIAAAVGTPVVAIYGSTSPDNTPPLTDAKAVITHRLTCSPCHQKVCPLGHTNCLVGIAPEEIIAVLSAPIFAERGAVA